MVEETSEAMSDKALLRLTATIIAAFVRRNALPPDQLPDAIRAVYAGAPAFPWRGATGSCRSDPGVDRARVSGLSRMRPASDDAQAAFAGASRHDACRVPTDVGSLA